MSNLFIRNPSKYNFREYKYWTVEYLENAFKKDPLNKEDIEKVYCAGYLICYYNTKGPVLPPQACLINELKQIHIQKVNPKEDICSLIHEIIHILFPFNRKTCRVPPDFLPKSFEDAIEQETIRIYEKNPQLVLHTQSLFRFPTGNVYPDPNQLNLF